MHLEPVHLHRATAPAAAPATSAAAAAAVSVVVDDGGGCHMTFSPCLTPVFLLF